MSNTADAKRDEAAGLLLHYLDIAGQGNSGRRIRGSRDYEVEIRSIVDLIIESAELRIIEKLERAAAAADKKRRRPVSPPVALATPEPPAAPDPEEEEPDPAPTPAGADHQEGEPNA